MKPRFPFRVFSRALWATSSPSANETPSGGVAMSIHAGRFSLVERGFCQTCGTNLFYRLKKTTDYFLYLGLLGNQFHPRFKSQEYIDHRPDFYHFADETKTATEAEGQERLMAI